MLEKSEERKYLDSHPLVEFVDQPVGNLYLVDEDNNVRTVFYSVSQSSEDIAYRLKEEYNIRYRKFIIFAPNLFSVEWSNGFDRHSFEQNFFYRVCEIKLTKSEWDFIMKKQQKTQIEETIKIENNKNNMFLLLKNKTKNKI